MEGIFKVTEITVVERSRNDNREAEAKALPLRINNLQTHIQRPRTMRNRT